MNADLDSVVAFVIRRIEEEAERAGEPFDKDERFLLTHLPSEPEPVHVADPAHAYPVPRDFQYEKIYRSAKSAHRRDKAEDPDGERQWNFAATVLKRHSHPLFRVLGWAGLREVRPWWDRWLLWPAGFLLVIVLLGSMYLIGVEQPSKLMITIGVLANLTLLLALYFAMKKLENWELDRTIEYLRRRINTA